MDSVMNSTNDEASDYPGYHDDDNRNSSVDTTVDPARCTGMCVLLATLYVIIMVLGITGNGLVIWIAGFKTKSRLKTVNTIWYLSLAVSDFLFCAFLPFFIVYLVKSDWVFGQFMCKFKFFILFLNMLSSIFLLVIISVDRCVVVMFPVWAQNKRTIRRALVMVLLAWIISALLSSPAAIFRDTHIKHNSRHLCYYTHNKERIAVVVCQLIFGFVIPLLIIIICYFLITVKLKSNQLARSNKPFMIMTALVASFIICWLPYHVFNLLALNLKHESVNIGGRFGDVLASTNSFINPLLYTFMGRDFKIKFYAFLSRIESTFEEEAQNKTQGASLSTSRDDRL